MGDYEDGIDGTCGPCGKGYPTSENKADERLFSRFSFSGLSSGSGHEAIESRVVDALRKAGEENKQGLTEQDIGEKLVEGLAMMVDQVSDDEENEAKAGELCKDGGVEKGYLFERNCEKGLVCLPQKGVVAIGGEVPHTCQSSDSRLYNLWCCILKNPDCC